MKETNRSERVIELAAQIKFHRDKALELERKLREEVGPPPLKIVSASYVPKILTLLDENTHRAFNVREIAVRIAAKNEASVRTACSRMAKRKQIRKAKPQGYQSARQ